MMRFSLQIKPLSLSLSIYALELLRPIIPIDTICFLHASLIVLSRQLQLHVLQKIISAKMTRRSILSHIFLKNWKLRSLLALREMEESSTDLTNLMENSGNHVMLTFAMVEETATTTTMSQLCSFPTSLDVGALAMLSNSDQLAQPTLIPAASKTQLSSIASAWLCSVFLQSSWLYDSKTKPNIQTIHNL